MTTDRAAPLTAEDRLDILELFARYGWFFDAGEADAFVALFTPTAAYDLDGGRRFEGHEQIKGYVEQAARSAWLPGRQHHVDQAIIEGDSSRVISRAYCTVTHRSADGTMSIAYLGRYADICVKVDGRWLFEQRTVRSWSPDDNRAAQQ